jgi:hypothetical protein
MSESPIGREWLQVLEIIRRSRNRDLIDIEISRLFFYAGARAVLRGGLANPVTLVSMAAELSDFDNERLGRDTTGPVRVQ